MTKVSIVSDHTVASVRRLRQIVAKKSVPR